MSMSVILLDKGFVIMELKVSGMYVVGSKQTLNTEEAHMPMQVDVRDTSSVPGLGRSPGGGQPIPVFLAGESHGQRSLVGLPSIGTQSWTRLK